MRMASFNNICSRGFDCLVVIRKKDANDVLANRDMSFDFESDAYAIVSDDSRRTYRRSWLNGVVIHLAQFLC